jgi:hypothetical protein
MMTKQAIWLRLGLVLLAAIALCGAASAQNTVEEFYRGRQINLIIGRAGRRLRPWSGACSAISAATFPGIHDRRAERTRSRQHARGQLSLFRRAEDGRPSACSAVIWR